MSAATQTMRQRRALHQLTGAASYAAHAALPLARDHAEGAHLRWELDRAQRHATQLQADALQRRVRAAGEVGCAPVDRLPSLFERLTTALRAEYGPRWWQALIAAALYFGTGTAAGVAVIAVCAGWQP